MTEKAIQQVAAIVAANSGEPAIDLSAIVMPSKNKGRGRLKGRALTAISLPAKPKGLIAFRDKSQEHQTRDNLGWFIDASMLEVIMCGEHKICKNNLKLQSLTDSIADEFVDLQPLAPYFEGTAFASLKKAVGLKKNDVH